MAPTERGRSNREDGRESPPPPAVIKGVLPEKLPVDVVVTVPGGAEGELQEGGRRNMEERKSGFSQSGCVQTVMLVLVAVLSVSQVMLWMQVTLGGVCPHNNQLPPPPHSASHLPHSSSPSLPINKDSHKGKAIVESVNEAVSIHKRAIDDPLPLYMTVDQYADDRKALQTQIAEMVDHPSARLVMNGYVPTHEIDTQNSFQWRPMTPQSLFNLTDSGQELKAATSGYHQISLTVMFSGRTSINSRLPSCSLKVAIKAAGTNGYTHTTLLFVSRTQNQMGLRIGAFYPIDTAHASGNFLLRRGDVIFVRPGTWSLGCQIHTEPYKTHLDAMLISKTGD